MYWITTTDQVRRERWQTAIGTDKLPVTTPRPINIKRGLGYKSCFMVDARHLTTIQRLRLIGYVWRTQRISSVAATHLVDDGLLIDGRDCDVVVVEPVNDDSPALLLFAYAT